MTDGSTVVRIMTVGAPWLGLAWVLSFVPIGPVRWRTLIALGISALLLLLPVGDWRAWAWCAAFYNAPSIVFTALLFAAVWQRLGLQPLLRHRDWVAAWTFGAAAAVLLYPMSLGLTPVDSYGFGWSRWLPLAVAGLTSVLILSGNRLGVLLLLAPALLLAGQDTSRNYWDMLIDPVYGAVSLIALLMVLVQRWRGGVRAARQASSSGTAVG